jgi:hypothetical protein
MIEMLSEKYKKLVRQVYIDPIRTVVVVDDDFPTLDNLLASAESINVPFDAPKSFSKEITNSTPSAVPTSNATEVTTRAVNTVPEQSVTMRFNGQLAEVHRLMGLLKLCREHIPPWMIDVHDGSAETGLDELKLAPSLHQSDLMILDFHLTGDHGDGSRAINILKELASNDQFNLVVVYTKGISGGIDEVFNQIAVALAYSNWSDGPTFSKVEATRSLVTDWEVEEDGLDVGKLLLESFSIMDYLKERSGNFQFDGSGIQQLIARLLEKCPEQIRNRSVPYTAADDTKKNMRLSPSSLFDYVKLLQHEALKDSLSAVDYGNFGCNIDVNHNWMRLDKIFITVVNKTTADPSTLEGCLLNALENWAPGPHQLLMGQMRAQLNEKGVGAEGAVLANRALQAGWLHELLDSQGDADTVMTQSINRHWEALGDRIYSDVKEYAKQMLEYFRVEDRTKIEKKYMPLGVTPEERLAHLNHYYSTKPVDSLHLTTGQIFRLEDHDAVATLQYWICLSPACDLVPGQKRSGWKQRLGKSMPFIAVQLEETNLKAALKEITQNRFIFINHGHLMKAFKFTTDSQSTSLPIWEQMFANETGKFASEPEDSQPTLTVQRMREQDGKLNMQASKATIVCQLRYEYALNFLHRLGSTLSRVGLDFRSL